MKPTLIVTNWSSWKKLHGSGRKWSIMARPRHWERGDGQIWWLTPWASWVRDARNGTRSLQAYRALYDDFLKVDTLEPGGLLGVLGGLDEGGIVVADGDTLCCACSRDKAAAGECHRVWAAEALVAAGWRVVLDGRELEA